MYEEFLRQVPLFADLPLEDLTRLCQMVGEIHLPAGQVLFHEGSLADRAYILYTGELEVVKNVDGRELQIDTQAKPGTVIGEMALLEETTRLATVRALQDSFLLTLDHHQMHQLLNLSSTAATVMLHTLTRRWRGIESLVRHNEKMAQLGTLTAGIAHELNNPIAAVSRSANQLQAMLRRSEQARIALAHLHLTADQQTEVTALARRVEAAANRPLVLDALGRSDREEEVESWLEEQNIPNPWELAPALVNLELSLADLAGLSTTFSGEQFIILLRWLEAACTTQSLLSEIVQGAGRMAEIVSALKSYVYLDQAPIQNVNVHEGLEGTLVILRHKLGRDVIIRRDYAPDLPKITAYGSELNQVWTNIIANAADALNGRGHLTLRTRQEGNEVVVEIEDDGPGIAPAHLPRLFDPFFTTKPPGKGTGLGLYISYQIVTKHQGEILVTSTPGQTLFQVRLPLGLTR
jgi:signal transduction histidine kinase